MTTRYAVYLAPPPESDLWRLGSRVLGRDAASGEEDESFSPLGWTAEAWRDLTAEPRRYGFHATLHAPFRLAEGRSREDLDAVLDTIAQSQSAFDLGPLELTGLALGGGGFVALRPRAAPPQLAELEAATLRALKPLRAPLTEAEIRRRRPERLSERQRAHLAEWGYPYVLDEFRPHFTLSGHAPDPAVVAAALAPAFAVDTRGFLVDALVLFVEAEGAPFRIARRFALTS